MHNSKVLKHAVGLRSWATHISRTCYHENFFFTRHFYATPSNFCLLYVDLHLESIITNTIVNMSKIVWANFSTDFWHFQCLLNGLSYRMRHSLIEKFLSKIIRALSVVILPTGCGILIIPLLKSYDARYV